MRFLSNTAPRGLLWVVGLGVCGCGDLLTEVNGQVTLVGKVAVVGVAAGDDRHVDVEQCRSAVA